MIRSEADLREQEARINKLRKEAETEDTENKVVVEIKGCEEEWLK